MKPGQRIKVSRLEKGMTQHELATLTHINIRTIQRIENNEVIPRLHSLKTIAAVLNIELQLLLNTDIPEPEIEKNENKVKLAGLHLSGLLLLPTLLIWLFEKDRNPDIKTHGIDVINFQLSMLAILLPCLFLAFVPVLIAIFTTVVVGVNTIKVMTNHPYHYPLTISFLKP
jgi:transcriptional regulator with XRE-family HTH domain